MNILIDWIKSSKKAIDTKRYKKIIYKVDSDDENRKTLKEILRLFLYSDIR